MWLSWYTCAFDKAQRICTFLRMKREIYEIRLISCALSKPNNWTQPPTSLSPASYRHHKYPTKDLPTRFISSMNQSSILRFWLTVLRNELLRPTSIHIFGGGRVRWRTSFFYIPLYEPQWVFIYLYLCVLVRQTISPEGDPKKKKKASSVPILWIPFENKHRWISIWGLDCLCFSCSAGIGVTWLTERGQSRRIQPR